MARRPIETLHPFPGNRSVDVLPWNLLSPCPVQESQLSPVAERVMLVVFIVVNYE